jgi:hypothetical protein
MMLGFVLSIFGLGFIWGSAFTAMWLGMWRRR